MQITQNWHAALEAARRGDLCPAREAREAEPSGSLAHYFFARCLAEAPPIQPDQYAEAVRILLPEAESQPTNPLFSQTLGLAFAREGSAESIKQATFLWKSSGLPHDLDLLGQAALTIEFQLRPLPRAPLSADLPWPLMLENPADTPDPSSDILSLEPVSNPPLAAAALSPPALPRLGFFQRRALGSKLGGLEDFLIAHEPRRALEGIAALLDEGLENEELHLLAGIASEEAGDASRARAHLAHAMRLAPSALIVRTALARVYWRLNWLDLAESLMRSLPVEGPYDYGRHYHLALIHEAKGDRPAAIAAINLALRDFFYDTRHYFIKRAYERWLARPAG